MHGRAVCLALLLVAIPASALADPPSAHAPESVYALSPILDGTLIAVGAGVSGGLYAFGNPLIDESCPCDPNRLNALDRSVVNNRSGFAAGVAGVGLGVILLGLPVLDWLDVGFGPVLLEDVVVYGEALAISGAFVSITKYAVQRPFPETWAGNARLISSPNGYRSFYSGHVSLTAAALTSAAVTYTLRHGAAVWPWVATGALTVGLSAAVIAAGWHFYTDAAMGAVAGAAVGLAVSYLHRHRDAEGGFAIVPIPSGGAAASYARRF